MLPTRSAKAPPGRQMRVHGRRWDTETVCLTERFNSTAAPVPSVGTGHQRNLWIVLGNTAIGPFLFPALWRPSHHWWDPLQEEVHQNAVDTTGYA